MERRIKRIIVLIPLVLVGMVVFITVGGVVVRELWNWLVPSLFGWPPIAFWQALGLLLLCRILFGGFGCHGSGRSSSRRLEDRYERLSPEERERFRQRMRERWGIGGVPSGGDQSA